MNTVRALACLAGLLMLAACGGGGGGGGGGGSSRGSLTLSTSTLTFTANGTQTPASQNVTASVSGNVGETVYLRIVSTGAAVSRIDNIILTSNTTGQGTVVPAPATTLGPGVHTSTITVTACTTNTQCASGVIGSPQTIAVTYTISGVAASTTLLSYSVGLHPTAGDLTKTLPVDAHPSFTAASSMDWLTVSPSSGGSGSTQLNLNLVQSAVDTLPSGRTGALVTLTAPSGPPLVVPVALTITKPQLDRAMPYVAGANQSAPVAVSGLYLDQLAGGSVELVATNGGTHALTNLTLNSTTLEVTHPALPAGSYTFRMRNGQGQVIDRSTARLLVVDNSVITSRLIPWPVGSDVRSVSSVLFDPERRALRLAGRNGATVDDSAMLTTEYQAATSSWSPATIRPYPRLDDVALSADGLTLFATSSTYLNSVEYARIAELSSTTFAEQEVHTGTTGYSAYPRPVPLNTNELMVVLAYPEVNGGSGDGLYRYSMPGNSLTLMWGDALTDGRVAASGNGQRVIAGSGGAYASVWEYTVSSERNLTRSPLNCQVDELDMDRKGETVLVRGRESSGNHDVFVRLYDRFWTQRGSLPITGHGHVLSPDGSRAYVYPGNGDQLHVYDLTAPPVGGLFPEVQTITLAGIPSSVALTEVAMTLSPDGKVLFVAGNQGIAVQQLP
jgi:hypothetical protein